MNHTYRLVWNEAAQHYVPAAESARCRGKSGGCRALTPLRAIILAAVLGGTYVCSADAAPSGGTVAAGQGTISQTRSAPAAPSGGQVTSGNGGIAQGGNSTVINQQSQNLAIDWSSFSIGANESVRFNQPNSTAIALNRVIGTEASQIYGHLFANGQVFLINPNGVLFAPGAQVDVGSLVASSLNISNADFLAGNYKFKAGSSKSAGSAPPANVINQGSITAAAGGSVALLGGQVSNQGTITAQLGTVALAAGSAMILDFRGTKLMSVQVDRSAVGALAENRQLIQADGGTVIMTAAARDALLNTVVNNTGVIEARTIENQGGEIKLLGSPDGGTVNVNGTLDASAPSGGNGGSIETSGAHVEIADTVHITTAAPTGKTGTWLVDPTDFTIAPSGGDITGATLSSELSSNSVTLASSSGSVSGNGDIFVDDAVSWNSNNTLTLTATHNIQINGTITANGNTAGLTLNYGSGGNYYVNTGGKVTLSGTNPSFSVNGQAYTVINSLGVEGDTTSTTLQGIQNNLPGFYVLGTDIDAAATSGWNSVGGTPWGFTPLGNSSTPFTGVFDGLNHTVTGLTINRTNRSYIGLFGDTSGTIRNVGLLGGSVIGQLNVGALVGYNVGTIDNSYATTPVSATLAQVGGLVGWNNNSGSISNSYATGTVSGPGYVGGLVGWNNVGNISGSYATGSVTSTAPDAGGLVGRMSSGSNTPTITNSYATGSVQSTAVNTGGLVGNLINGAIINSYATGAVTGTTNVGGLVGAVGTGTSVTKSFWDTTTSHQNASAGGGKGMTTTQMQSLADFTSATTANGNVNPNWDFTSVWRIYDGYTAPLLKALLIPLTITATDMSATYNGSGSNATLTSPVYSVAGADSSGHLQNIATPYSNGRNVGIYAPVLWSDQQGYDITVKNSTLTINPAVLTLTANTDTKIYDGTATSTVLPTIGGLQTGDTLTGVVQAYDTRNAGTGKTLAIVNGYTLTDGNSGGNYTVNKVADNTGVINKATLTLTAHTDTKTYDGSAASSIAPTIAGLQTGDTLTGVTEAFDTKNVGTGKTLAIASGYTLTDGNSGGNYTVNKVADNTGVISKATLTLTAHTDTKTYDGSAASTVLPTISGLQTGDTLTGVVQAYDTRNAGTGKTLAIASGYTLTDGNSGGNYTVNKVADNTGVISQATLTLTAHTDNKIYDGTAASSIAPTVTGLQTGDTLTGVTEAFDTKNVGTGKTLAIVSGYTLTDGNSGGNYTVNKVADNTGVINKATLTLTAHTDTKTYDGSAASTVLPTITGLQTGDTLTGVTEAFDTKNAGTGKTLAIVSGYTLTDGNSGGNYTVNKVADNTGVISQATLTLTAHTDNKIYDGSAASSIAPTIAGLQTGDTLTGVVQAYDTRNAGTGKTLAIANGYTLTDGNSGGNYTVNKVADNTGVISKATLTLTAHTDNKIYDGTAASSIAPTVAGLQTGDTLTGVTEAFDTKNVGTGKTLAIVSGYTLTDGNSGGNYTVNKVADNTGVINKATLTLTAHTDTKTYDGSAASTVLPTISGLQTGDTLTGVVQAYDTRNAGTGKTLAIASGYTLTDGNSGGNYTVNKVADNTGVISQATLTLTAHTDNKIYDGTAASSIAPTVAGLQTGDTLTGVVQAYDTRNAGTGKTLAIANGYTLTDGNSGGNYTVNKVADNAGVISKATLTLTAHTDTKTYDGTAASSIAPTVAGLQTGDTLTGVTEAFDTKNVGTGKTLAIASGYTLTDGNSGGNYTVNKVADNTGVISKATLTLTAHTDTKIYDGSAASTVLPTITGLQTGDTLTGVTEAFDTKNAGTGKTLAIASGYILTDGNSGGNYTVNKVADNTGVISKATLTLTAHTDTKIYDGSAASTVLPTITGLQTGDTLTGVTEAFDTKNAGTGKTLAIVSGYTLTDGNSGGNYTVNKVADNTGVISTATLTLTAKTDTKTYDGTATSTVLPTITGLQTGDTLTGATEAYDTRNAGTGKTLAIANGYTLTDGNSGGNYTVNKVADNTGVISKATLTVTAHTDTKTYDGTAASTVLPTISGLQTGDTLTGATEAYDTKNVGTGKTLAIANGYTLNDGNSGANYTVNKVADNTGVINKAALTVTGATAANKTYDGSVDATISGGVLNGIFGGDSIGLLQTGLFSDRNAGTNKTVTDTFGLTGSDSGNYTLANGTGRTTANITPKMLAVVANAKTKTYGQADPMLSYTSSGYVSGTFNGVTVNDTAASVLTGMLTRAVGEAVHGGPYAIRQGSLASTGNYTISYTPNFLTINPATITVSGITANDKPYDATTTATLNTGAASLVGRIGSDNLGLTATGAFAAPDAGTGKTVAISNFTLTGTASANYVLAPTGNESSTTASITPDMLTITADNATKMAGSINPALTLTYSGFVEGERASSLTTRPTVSTTAGTTSPAGNYAITASGAVDPNYIFTYVPGTLTVLGNAATSSPGYTGALANVGSTGTSGTPGSGTTGSGSGVGEGAQHGVALDCSAYVRCVEIPSYLVETDGEDMRGNSKGALSLWSLIILDGGISLPQGAADWSQTTVGIPSQRAR